MNRPGGRVKWAVAVFGITFIVLGCLTMFYTGYAIERNNREQLQIIDEQRISSNQQFCGILKLILDTGRPGPFKDAVAKVYDSQDYQCEKVENQP
jgi:hypothetical protein